MPSPRSLISLALAALLNFGGQAAARDGSELTLIRNVNVVDTETGKVAVKSAILLRAEGIIAIGRAAKAQAPKAAVVIDGRDAFAIPGLWDAHVHIMQDDKEASLAYARKLVGHGVTHVRDMGANPDVRTAALRRFSQPGVVAPSVISAGPTLWAFASEYGDPRQRVVIAKVQDTDAAVAKIAATGVDFLKVYAGFDRARLEPLAMAAKAHGLPLAGHAQPGMTLAEQVRLGLRSIEHVDFDAFAECVPKSDSYFSRVIGSRFSGAKETIPAIYSEFAAKADTAQCRAGLRDAAKAGLVFTPTLLVGYAPLKLARRLRAQFPSDKREACNLYLRQFDNLSADEQATLPAAGQRLLRLMLDAKPLLLAGTDSPTFCAEPGASLPAELSLMQQFGMTPLAVLQAATINPGRAFNRAKLGKLAPGYAADILLLAKNPLASADAYALPTGLYHQGKWRDQASLGSLRASIPTPDAAKSD